MVSDELVHGYAQALFNVVRAEGELDRVEDELFRFGKVLDSNHELKQALSDKSIDKEQREKVLRELLADKVSPHTLGLLGFIVAQGRARQATGKRVEVKVIVDPSLIGGVVAKIGDTIIDGSVKRRLQQLKEQVRS